MDMYNLVYLYTPYEAAKTIHKNFDKFRKQYPVFAKRSLTISWGIGGGGGTDLLAEIENLLVN